MPLNNRFSGDDPYVLTQQISTSNNNAATLNATIAENDHLRGKSVSISSQAIIRVPGTPFPQVLTAAENTVGAALGNVGQFGTYSQEPDGGGIPCFIEGTPIQTPDGDCYIEEIELETEPWLVLAFDANGKRIPKRVTDCFQHLVSGYTLVTFADGRQTGLIEDHRYWQMGEMFTPIRDIESVWHWDRAWKEVRITNREYIEGEIILYNFTVEGLHTYIANGDAVSNLKPIDGGEGGGPI